MGRRSSLLRLRKGGRGTFRRRTWGCHLGSCGLGGSGRTVRAVAQKEGRWGACFALEVEEEDCGCHCGGVCGLEADEIGWISGQRIFARNSLLMESQGGAGMNFAVVEQASPKLRQYVNHDPIETSLRQPYQKILTQTFDSALTFFLHQRAQETVQFNILRD